jgi:HAD superfamily hydrolase (TIGR01490 family)
VTLAIFDLDNTLIAGDSDHGWGQFLVDQGIVDPISFKQANDHFYQQYLEGKLDIYEYSEFSLGTLSQHPRQDLERWRQQFMDEVISQQRLPKAQALIDDHRAQGHFILIITATNDFVTKPIADSYGADHILATTGEVVDGRYTGKVFGTPCFQAGKIDRLNQWLEGQPYDLKGSYFYSDSFNDLPLLEIVDHPIAVDPDAKLAAYAKAHNWLIISLRETQKIQNHKKDI